MKNIILFVTGLILFGCSALKTTPTTPLRLKYLSEYIVPDSLLVKGTLVGGLSGIDLSDGSYYLICDDASHPRYYKASIEIHGDTISKIKFTKVYNIKDTTHFLDTEAIRFDTNHKKLVITSEGNIKKGFSPSVLTIDAQNEIEFIKIPDHFLVNSKLKPRNNGTFEGLSISYDKKGYWLAMELPLEADGPEPAYGYADSPVRITYIDSNSKEPIKQFAYYLEPITKEPKGKFGVNGVTEILAYDTDRFFVIERAFSSGWGTQGNTVRLFNVDASEATNTISSSGLALKDFKPAVKTLLLDLEDIRNQLTDRIIDNIEGMTFGPKLSSGNRSLLLVADNNFNQLGEQLNQFILLEIED